MAIPPKAEILYDQFVEKLRQSKLKVETGQFGTMMQVTLILER